MPENNDKICSNWLVNPFLAAIDPMVTIIPEYATYGLRNVVTRFDNPLFQLFCEIRYLLIYHRFQLLSTKQKSIGTRSGECGERKTMKNNDGTRKKNGRSI